MEKNISVPMAVSAVISSPASKAVAMGIAGIQISYQNLFELFFTLVKDCDSSNCIKCDDPGVSCFLTTTAGQIILSTAGDKAVCVFLVYYIVILRKLYEIWIAIYVAGQSKC